MACKVNWTNRAWLTYEANIKYLEETWTPKGISNFVLLTDKRIARLSTHPRTGTSRNKKYPNVRFTLVHKRVALIYCHKPLKNEIDLLAFWNTYQNPRKLGVK